MFTIKFKTIKYRPDFQITLRTNSEGWDINIPGVYQGDEWTFKLEETTIKKPLLFKFVLEYTYWMIGEDRRIDSPVKDETYAYTSLEVQFPELTEALVENTTFQQKFFEPNFNEDPLYDFVIIGSGVGGGILADQLSDFGKDVLVLELGSVLFSTHVANLPRQHNVGKFDKHLWALFDEYKVINYTKEVGSPYEGGQAFNLGGRSVFWGGLIPRMTWWELEEWPDRIRWYLEDTGYNKAEDLMFWPPPPGQFQREVKTFLKKQLPNMDVFDAPMAVRHYNPAYGTIATGLFSTADLLTESRLSIDPSGNKPLTINLNQAVTKLNYENDKITSVEAFDLISRTKRLYKGKYVVLSAGTLESAKLAKLSGLKDPSGLVGTGITDHPIFYTHFAIAQGKEWHRTGDSCKILLRYKDASLDNHPYNVVIEIGADLNQGRYLDKDTLTRHQEKKGGATFCEIVFLFNSPLINENLVTHVGGSADKVYIQMTDSNSADAYEDDITILKDRLIEFFAGEAIEGENLTLKRAKLGGVAHEVGTLRLGVDKGVVNEDLKFNGYENLYVCDLSVFPTSPAANPTLTLAALSLRLADRLNGILNL